MTCEPTAVPSFPSSSDIRVHSLTSSSSASCSLLFHQAPITATPQRHGANCIATDEVTTIFVVGFPEDMTEREFQNMFTFSSGFEAASLKWHCKDQEDENGPPAGSTDTTTSTHTNNNTTTGKKQMIGFARFRTRLEALDAAEVMNGKRVDQERGILLKAEMAKKNLHIKRGPPASFASTTATQDILGSSPSPLGSSVLSSTLNNNKMQLTSPPQTHAAQVYHPHESFSPLPSDLLSPTDYYKLDPFMKDPYCCSAPATPIFSDGLFGLRAGAGDGDSQQQENNNSLGLMPSPPPRGLGLIPPPRMVKVVAQDNATTANGNEDPSCHHHCYLTKSSPVPNDRVFGPSSPPTDLPRCLNHNNNNSTTSGSSSSAIHHHHHTGDFRSQLLAPSSAATFRPSSLNPADQNPPCNTLYVGNLPPTTSEDELRQLFGKCRTFKRMSFRNKTQGPMCFVEFEDVVSATQAMNELQGHVLSTSVKGGIRLSFSKNPLFTKPIKDQQQMAPTTMVKRNLFAFESIH